jgi:tetratricopeptide (TPR) repeat protein
MSRLAKMNNDLSIAYRRIGQLDRAAEYAHKAVAIHEALNDRLSVARAETNLGLVLIRQREHATAAPHLDRALALFVEADQTRGRSHILLAQAELMLDVNDLSLAQAKAEEAAQLALQLGEMASVSEAKQVLATIAAAEGNHQESDALFMDAIRLLNELRLYERLTTVHAVYASDIGKERQSGGCY